MWFDSFGSIFEWFCCVLSDVMLKSDNIMCESGECEWLTFVRNSGEVRVLEEMSEWMK